MKAKPEPVTLQKMSLPEFLSIHPLLRSRMFPKDDLKEYLADYGTDLLNLSLSNTSDEVCNQAFVLLSTGEKYVTKILLSADTFLLKATEVLCDTNPDPSVINRLGAILSNILAKSEDSFTECMGFLPYLLKYIEYPSIFDVLMYICDVRSGLYELQEHICKLRFDNLVIAEFQSADSSKVCNLIALVNQCLIHPTIRHSFVNERVLALLVSLRESKNVMILNQLWRSFARICCEITVTKMQHLLEPAFSELSASEFHMYHIFVLDFLNKVMSFGFGSFTTTCQERLPEMIIDIMTKCENSTNMMHSVFRLMRTCVKYKSTRTMIFTKVLPLVVAFAGSPVRTAGAACSIRFVEEIEQSREGNSTVHQMLLANSSYTTFIATHMQAYRELSEPGYGGRVETSFSRSKSAIIAVSKPLFESDKKEASSD